MGDVEEKGGSPSHRMCIRYVHTVILILFTAL